MSATPPVGQRLAAAARRHWVAVALFAVLTVVLTWPLPAYLTRAIAGPPWDNLVWLYDTWWLREGLQGQHSSFLWNPSIFHPYGYDLTLSETTLANKLLLAPLLLAGASPALAFNLVVLLSFYLTALATYAWVVYLTRCRAAGILAGIAFAFGPYRIGVLGAGWLPLLATQWLPLEFLFLERWARENRLSDALLAGLFLALLGLSSWYYAYIAGLATAIYLLVRVRPWRAEWRDRRRWLHLAAMAVVAGALMAPVALPAARAGSQSAAWDLGSVEKWSASLEDFFYPNIYHPVWGQWFLSQRADVPTYPWYSPGFVFLGFVPIVLAALAMRRGRPGFAWPLAALAIVSFVMALGTTLHVGGDRLFIPVPQTVSRLFARGMYTLTTKLALNPVPYYPLQRPDAIPVPLPALLVYLFLPFGSAMRTLYRFGVLTTFSVATLAGAGLARLLAGGRRTWLAVALIVLVLVEFVSAPLPYGVTATGSQPLDEWLRALPADAVLMRFPLVAAWNGNALYRSALQGKVIAYGHGTFYPPEYMAHQETLEAFPSDQTLDLLQEWGVTHVMVGERAYDQGWGDQPGQRWADVLRGIEADGRLREVVVIDEQPRWLQERVSRIVRGALAVDPIQVDRVHVYELARK